MVGSILTKVNVNIDEVNLSETTVSRIRDKKVYDTAEDYKV